MKKILLVEDNEHDRIAFIRSIKKSGDDWEITACSRAEDALKFFENGVSPFDIIVSDFGLPGIDGLQMCKNLLAQNINTPMLLLTGSGSEKTASDAIKAGLYDYLIKDLGRGYLKLLPIALKEVLRMNEDREARLRAEKALRESEHKYATLVENARDGVVIVQDNAFKFANKAMCKISGFSMEELINRDVFNCISEELITKMIDQHTTYMNGDKLELFESQIHCKSGNIKTINISASCITYEGKPALMWIVRDISVRKKLETDLNKSLKEKELLIREIHHRVKNNFAIISNLITLQSFNMSSDYQRIFADIINRIKTLSLIHEKLYRSDNLSQINFKSYIISLASELIDSYKSDASDRIKLAIDIKDELVFEIDIAILCGIIINELLTNTLKYAFPNGRSGQITIAAARHEGGQIEIIFADNGVGIPEDIDIYNSDSLGMELVTSIVEKQLKGTIQLDVTHGAQFKISFKPSAL
jgi:PAS domain S-box-containing protein